MSIESTEELREALATLRLQHDALEQSKLHTQQLLDTVEALLGLQPGDDPFAHMFASLHEVFTFSHALLLTESAVAPGRLDCIAAEPAALIGSRWPTGPLFDKVRKGRVLTTLSHANVAEWRDAAALGLRPEQAALYAPVNLRGQSGILVLLSALGAAGFDRSEFPLVRRFAMLASVALAKRVASEGATEGHRLRELATQLQQSQQFAQRNADLLNEVVNVLPLGLTVQDDTGRLLVINDAAAVVAGSSAAALRGRIAFELLGGDDEAVQRRKLAFQRHLREGRQSAREHTLDIGGEQRTLLTTGKPVRVFDELLLVSASMDITERKRFEDELSHRAFHDPLTGLPNQALMTKFVENAIAARQRGGMFALAFIDLDNFKQVNDYYSHAAGDALLIAVAARIREKIRSADVLARISGDEFLLLFNPLSDVADLHPCIDRIGEALKQPFLIDGHEVLTSASIGTSIYPQHGADYETLRRCADNAMYRAKHHRKGSASHYDVQIDSGLTARMQLEQQLRVAIRERHFKSAFQPKVDLRSRRVIGFEALVRWVEPDGSVRMPGSFIELASELGLLDDITRFVLDDVARSLPQLTAHYGSDVSVSLNVSARQAGDALFMESFIEQLGATGLGRQLVVELTEDALVATQHFQRRTLPRLRRLGVRVSIDDFGTGYSSLSTLADITADEIKVDRAFITAIHQRVRSQGILKAIESLCVALDVGMVAEGVETAEELAYLQAHTSIRSAQGYFFSKPAFLDQLVPPDAVEAPTHQPVGAAVV